MNLNLRPVPQTVRFAQQADAGKAPRARHQVVHNFRTFLGTAGSYPITRVGLSRLFSMLERADGQVCQYAIVHKRASNSPLKYATTVVNVSLRKVYWAEHPCCIAKLWKALAANTNDHVQYIDPSKEFTPQPEPEKIALECGTSPHVEQTNEQHLLGPPEVQPSVRPKQFASIHDLSSLIDSSERARQRPLFSVAGRDAYRTFAGDSAQGRVADCGFPVFRAPGSTPRVVAAQDLDVMLSRLDYRESAHGPIE